MGVYKEFFDLTGLAPSGVDVHPKSVWVATATGNPFPVAAVGMRALMSRPGEEFKVLGDELVGALPEARRQLPDQLREAGLDYTYGAVRRGLSI